MKVAAHIENFHGERIRQITEIFCKSADRLTEEDFHDLRVEIKKLRAVLALAKYQAPHLRRKKILKPFLAIFRQAGKVRTLQLQLSFANEWQRELPAYSRYIKQRLQFEERKFEDLRGPWNQELVCSATKLHPHFERVNDEQINEYLDRKVKNIRLILQGPMEEDVLHPLRKLIKEYRFTLQIFDLEGRCPDDILLFESLLGEWHDHFIFYEDAMKLPPLPRREPGIVQAMAADSKKRSNTLVNKIRRNKDQLHHCLYFQSPSFVD